METWAALTGMLAVGENPEHPSVQRGVEWLHSIQNLDGGWGESCASDQKKRYIPLRQSTLSQTAWALDALVAYHPKPTPAMGKGVQNLLNAMNKVDHEVYPTGAGLRPLLAMSHYKSKYDHLPI